jgi:hypothetical protein
LSRPSALSRYASVHDFETLTLERQRRLTFNQESFGEGNDMLVSGDCVNRAAIIAAIVTSTLPFSSPSLAASDAEMAGDKMTGAFRCLTYARMFHDYKEEQRLFQIGVKAGREFAEQFRSDPKFSEITAYVPSTDFLVGIMYNEQTTKAHD